MNTTKILAQGALPVISGATIRRDAVGRYNLNDLHRASGGANKHRPSLFLQNQGTKRVIAEVREQSRNSCFGVAEPVVTNHGGSQPGIYADEIVAIEYAGWVSAAFRVTVNRTFIHVHRPASPVAVPESLPEALRLAADLAEQNTALRAQNAGYQRLTETNQQYCLRDAAKMLKLRPKTLRDYLISWKWLYRVNGKNKAYQRAIDAELLACRLVNIETGGGCRTEQQVRVTGKGLARIGEALEQAVAA